jgi:hypothetical protein
MFAFEGFQFGTRRAISSLEPEDLDREVAQPLRGIGGLHQCPCICIIYIIRQVLDYPGEGGLDHPIAFSSRNLSTIIENYTTIECEGLEMVYALQKFRHYILGSHFNMYTNHFVLSYLFNKTMFGGEIC